MVQWKKRRERNTVIKRVDLPATISLHAVGTVDCWLAHDYATGASVSVFVLVRFERAIADPIWIWGRGANAFGRVAVIVLAAYAAGATEALIT